MFGMMAVGVQAEIVPPAGYRLVWEDEFRRDGRPDPANWTYQTGFVRNRELQWYQPQNAVVRHGLLIIEGRRERVKNPQYNSTSSDWQKNREYADYTSACLITRGLHEWTFGRVEVRAKISAKAGLWPAIWMLGAGRTWPSCGEVDMLEFYRNTILANTMDGNGRWNTVRTPYKNFTDVNPSWDKTFHTWRMDWDANSIDLYLDDRLLNHTDIRGTRNPDGVNPFHQPEYLLLNLAIGSTGGDPSQTKFPTRYEIQSVRVFQKNP
jgi:beta-glucanase (GH16 family)